MRLQDGTNVVDRVDSGKDTRNYMPRGNLCRLFGLEDHVESDRHVDLVVSAHEAPFYVDFCQSPELRRFVAHFMGWKKSHVPAYYRSCIRT